MGFVQYGHSNNAMSFNTNDAEAMRIDSVGGLLVAHTTSRNNFNSAASTEHAPIIQLEGINQKRAISITSTNNNDGGILMLARQNGNPGANTAVSSGDQIGRVDFQASGGTNMEVAAQITAEVDGTPGDNDMPGRLLFKTTADGASAATTRLTINQGGNATFAGIATATQFVPTSSQLSHRNLIINGNFRIAERATTHGSSGYRTVDRFRMQAGGASGSLTQLQYGLSHGDAPHDNDGHGYAYRILNAGQNANNQGYVYMQTLIEAQDMLSSGWQYRDSSSYLTLSFWIRSSETQTHLVSLLTSDVTNREWNHLVSLTSDTWTKVSITVPGDSNITFNKDNGIGLGIYLHAYLGDHYTSGSTVDQWVNHAGYTSRPDMGAGWWTSSNSTFMLTGVQLEAGPMATPFEHRSYGEELERCQRYFYKHPIVGAVGPYACQYHANHRFVHDFFPTRMRATPTATVTYNAGAPEAPTAYYINEVHYKAYVGSSGYDSTTTTYITAAQYDAELS